MKYGNIRSPSVSAAHIRQTVLFGSRDGSGFPNAISAGAGLSISLAAASTAFRIAFAAGFDGNGAVDYVGSYTADQSLGSLTANSTCYLYVDRDSTGTLTLGFSTLGPVYDYVAPSTSTGQHWFDLGTYTMKRWSGSAWVEFQRVFIGEAVTGASTVSSVKTYAYQGLYASAWTAVAASSYYTLNHNLGIYLPQANPELQMWWSVTGADNAATKTTHLYRISEDRGWTAWLQQVSDTRNSFGFYVGAIVGYNASGGNATSGYYKLTIKRGW